MALDRVNYCKVFDKLLVRGIPENIVKLFMYCMVNYTQVFKVVGALYLSQLLVLDEEGPCLPTL